ncbi:MAG: cytochrome c family protein [Sphingomonadales bacterium]|nr:MAG: cytochrome c family protein [Sphingomonadales bacterium]
MAFLIRTIDHTATGREIVRERQVQGASLTVGRAAENDVHLPDLAVEQQHIRIDQTTSGELSVSALGTLGFALDGRHTTSGTIDPKTGGELALGSSILSFDLDDSGAVRVSIRSSEAREDARDAKASFALAAAMPSKRALSWGFAVAILLAFLAIPIVSHMARDRIPNDDANDSRQREGQVAFDGSWSTGSLSLAHHGLEDNCEACHVDAFVSVRDETCLTCHKDIGDHAAEPRLANGRAPMSLGDGFQWAVAGMFGKEGPGACTTCHTEHEGPTRMEPAAQQFCADCHETLDTRLTDTALGNASDFGKAHPEFKPAIFTELRQDKPVRISLGDKPRENSGIKFPHDLHLDPQGGVARMAIRLGRRAGYGAPLECKACHTETSDKIGFEPVDMEENCESCHSLVYDQIGGTFRTLRHGDVEQMWADLRAMDRAPRRPIVTGRSRPDKFARGGLYYSNFGSPLRSLVGVDRALAPGGVCGECHLPASTNGQPDVMPVNLPDRFLAHGGFDHGAHSQEKCSTCHKAETSKTATDLLIPDLKSCRECHQGEAAIEAEVPSGCAMCHSYHVPSTPLPQDHPDRRVNDVAILDRIRR